MIKEITKDMSYQSYFSKSLDDDEIKVGSRYEGIVKSIQPYGAFIEIAKNRVGLLHIEDISISRIKTPYERFKIGQKVEVMVKSIDRKTNHILLTHKELLGSWEENIKTFREGSKVKGIVKEADNYKNGIFVELTPNLVGLAEYREDVEYGKMVDVYIKKIIPEKKKVKLVILQEQQEKRKIE